MRSSKYELSFLFTVIIGDRKMKAFYYTQDWGTVLDVPNILLSYGVALHPNGKMKKYNLDHAESVFLDCGAYTLRNKFTKYPTAHYIKWIKTFQNDNLEYVATVDIIGDYEGTVRAGVECLESDDTIPWVPVLQGVSVEDYSKCADLYKKEGIDLSNRLVAVGGLKKRKSVVIRCILDSLKDYKVHAFGLTLTNLKDPNIWYNVFSTDSGTWKQRPSTTKQKYQQLEKFKKDLDLLTHDYDAQTVLLF